MGQAPSGTVTFLFTDIEGSTRLWEDRPEAMRAALATHDELLRAAIEAHGGHLVKSTGDGAFAAFANARGGVAAAIAAQVALAAADWPEGVELRARMGLHVGPATVQDGDYFGADVTRTARLMSVAHGGQIVCSRPVGDLVSDQFTLVDLGEHRLRDLQSSMHVCQVEVPGAETVFPPLRSLNARPGNLPRQVTTFVGRETLIRSLADGVRESSVLTVTGVGGVGKTRLALQVAAEVVTDFPDGAWLCEFAPVTDPGAVWDALAASLRVQALTGRSIEESTLEYLAAKRVLLVLDNCEHLLDPISHQVDAITQRCPSVSVLATSREGLGLAGERIFAVPSLGVAADETDIEALIGSDAVQLFSDRAHAAKADFVLTDRNAGAVGVLCRRLDGIPLAIELAAARVRSLSPEDLVERLDQRFKLLSRGSRAALERHQTLRSTIDWSYDLLDPTERHALDCLSVFVGSCDLAAAESVLATADLDELDVADVLGQLVDKSLVVAETDADGGVRYTLLETIRQYAAERLQAGGGTAAVRRRHADRYVEVAETARPHLRSRDQVEWSETVLRDVDNFRVVLDWAVETGSPDHTLRMIAPFSVTNMRIGDVARDWAETASTMPNARDHPRFSDVAAFASLAATLAGDFDRAEARVAAAEQGHTTPGPPVPSVLIARAALALYQGDFDGARQHAEACLGIARATGDPYELSGALALAAATVHLTEPETTIVMLEEGIQVARDAGLAYALSIPLGFLAGILPLQESARALALLDEAIEVSARLDDRMGVSLAMGNKAGVAVQRREWRTALQAILSCSELQLELGDLPNLTGTLGFAGCVLCSLGHLEPAAVLRGHAGTIFERTFFTSWVHEAVEATDAILDERLDAQQLAILIARGAALQAVEAVAYLREQADAVLRETQ